MEGSMDAGDGRTLSADRGSLRPLPVARQTTTSSACTRAVVSKGCRAAMGRAPARLDEDRFEPGQQLLGFEDLSVAHAERTPPRLPDGAQRLGPIEGIPRRHRGADGVGALHL